MAQPQRPDRFRPKDRRPVPAPKKPRPPIQFGTVNWVLMGVGLAVIAAGFITLSRGSITIAPILLVVGYCVLIPVALIVGGRRPPKPTAPPADGTATTRVDGSGN